MSTRWMVGLSIGLLWSLVVLSPLQSSADAVTGFRAAVGQASFGLHMQ